MKLGRLVHKMGFDKTEVPMTVARDKVTKAEKGTDHKLSVR